MLLYFTDTVTKQSVAINPSYVVSALVIPEGEHKDKTAIILTNGNIVVEEAFLDVVGRLNGELK